MNRSPMDGRHDACVGTRSNLGSLDGLREHLQWAIELEHFARANEPRRAQHCVGLHVIARAPLVGGAPLRRTPLAVSGRTPRLSACMRR